ncbi:MAG TPA: 4-(cytidine 5'-diphospho)-2-C-methyl-D-erythritol kinase [Mycobacteriales bacterium]|nr:4-(cytidine 5'-diphospho)-2-C-methyl-D-erythritol kinase [Mycobacteriales bacterium]
MTRPPPPGGRMDAPPTHLWRPALPRTRSRVVARAPAKINLHLSVGRLRRDGFHDLITVFHAVSLTDEVTATPSDRLSIVVDGDDAASVPADATNLAWRAAALLADHTGRAPGVALRIRKSIPVAGGCAGGSADAAAALVACDALWGTGMTREGLASLAARLGSDVPFSLHGGTAMGTGRGERLTPVLARGSYAWVLALADGGLSTPAVYGELDRLRAGGRVAVAAQPSGVLAALRSGDATGLGRALHNDLQPAALALAPGLSALLEAGRGLGALGCLVSGSGPTVALLAESPSAADDLAARLAGGGLCRAVRRADGPVHGARVVEAA